MDQAIVVLKWILANYQAFLAAFVAVLSSLIALFMLIPGDQPEKALKQVLDFIAQWSRK